jgi:hypothetical protein
VATLELAHVQVVLPALEAAVLQDAPADSVEADVQAAVLAEADAPEVLVEVDALAVLAEAVTNIS